ncbi:hypothetical protein bcgnr5369_03300 [Bacillus cereus]|uniref:Uncharacterized protein n=1 Tax=Bacillus thuringiensis TaxID=1428 RepID=A0A9X6WSQ5_BACTU|nr:hypothetical protein [Bacillus thuringiensis]PFJ42768.1 hypothetical protein COJ15_05350 [Bacillus thuringiensis]
MKLGKLIEKLQTIREKEGNIDTDLGYLIDDYMQNEKKIKGLCVKEDSKTKQKKVIVHEEKFVPTPYYKEDKITLY